MSASRMLLRGRVRTVSTMSGAPAHTPRAYAEIKCPASGMLTPSVRATSGSIPMMENSDMQTPSVPRDRAARLLKTGWLIFIRYSVDALFKRGVELKASLTAGGAREHRQSGRGYVLPYRRCRHSQTFVAQDLLRPASPRREPRRKGGRPPFPPPHWTERIRNKGNQTHKTLPPPARAGRGLLLRQHSLPLCPCRRGAP